MIHHILITRSLPVYYFPFQTASRQKIFLNKIYNKKATFNSGFFLVIPLGLEPRTHTLKVYCSTNWATESGQRSQPSLSLQPAGILGALNANLILHHQLTILFFEWECKNKVLSILLQFFYFLLSTALWSICSICKVLFLKHFMVLPLFIPHIHQHKTYCEAERMFSIILYQFAKLYLADIFL